MLSVLFFRLAQPAKELMSMALNNSSILFVRSNAHRTNLFSNLICSNSCFTRALSMQMYNLQDNREKRLSFFLHIHNSGMDWYPLPNSNILARALVAAAFNIAPDFDRNNCVEAP